MWCMAPVGCCVSSDPTAPDHQRKCVVNDLHHGDRGRVGGERKLPIQLPQLENDGLRSGVRTPANTGLAPCAGCLRTSGPVTLSSVCQVFELLRCAAKADGLQPATSDTDVAQHGVVQLRYDAQIARLLISRAKLAISRAINSRARWPQVNDRPRAAERVNQEAYMWSVVLHQRGALPIRPSAETSARVRRKHCPASWPHSPAADQPGFRSPRLPASRLSDTENRLTRGM
jgi:hypothetical protein